MHLYHQLCWEMFFGGGNYERGLYNQLMEVIKRLDIVEKEIPQENPISQSMSTNSDCDLMVFKGNINCCILLS